jgi:hypothetical protein
MQYRYDVQGTLDKESWKGKSSWEWDEQSVHISSVRLLYDCSNKYNDEIIVQTNNKTTQIWNKTATITVALYEYEVHHEDGYVNEREYGVDAIFYVENWKTLVNTKCETCFNSTFFGEYKTIFRLPGSN